MTTYAAYPNSDGFWTSGGSWDATGTDWVAGATSTIRSAVFFWDATGIPQGCTINSAVMDYTKNAGAGTPDIRIHFEAADNPAFPSSKADAEGRTVTTAYGNITSLPADGRRSTPDLSASLQEVVDRGGFAADGIQLHWRDNKGTGTNYIQGRCIERTGTADDPYLTVDYTEPSDDLTANSIAAAAPSVGAPALGQIHALTATSIASAAPSVGSPTLAEIVALTADSVSTDSPSVDSPALGQIHALTATGVATAVPSVGSPALVLVVGLTADPLATSAPSVGSPALGQIHALTASSITTGAPTVDSPALGQIHALATGGIATAAPSVDSPALTQIHALIAEAIASGSPSVGSPMLGIAGVPAADRYPPIRVSVASSAPKSLALTTTRPRINRTTRSAPHD